MKPFDVAWRQVYWKLRELALDLNPGDPIGLTSHDVAAKYRVNIKTVTRAIRQLKAEGVLMTKRKHGTFVHPQCPTRAKDGKIILHVVLGYESRSHFPLLSSQVEILETIASKHKCRIITVSPQRLLDISDLLKEGQVFGAIVNTLNGVQDAKEAIERLRAFGVKICALDDPFPGVDSVIYDNEDIGRQIGEILIRRLGSERILALRSNSFCNGPFDRDEGFRKAIHTHRAEMKVIWLNYVSPSSRKARLAEAYMRYGIKFDCAYLPSPDDWQVMTNLCKSSKAPVPFMAAFGTREELEEKRIAGAYLNMEKYVGDAVNLLFEQAKEPLRPPVVIKHKAMTYIPV